MLFCYFHSSSNLIFILKFLAIALKKFTIVTTTRNESQKFLPYTLNFFLIFQLSQLFVQPCQILFIHKNKFKISTRIVNPPLSFSLLFTTSLDTIQKPLSISIINFINFFLSTLSKLLLLGRR
jgi:hypothetical protein